MQSLIIKHLGLQPYETVWQAMQAFTDTRDENTPDQFWLVQHPPVFTQGLAGKAIHILDPKDIPIVHTDRGGQVTYHAPGQAILYPLVDLKRHDLGLRSFVTLLEEAAISVLSQHGVQAHTKPKAPGVYVQEAKIASLGLKVRRGCTYHGISLNVDMNLEPFSWINPCGYPHLKMVQLSDFQPNTPVDTITFDLAKALAQRIKYEHIMIS